MLRSDSRKRNIKRVILIRITVVPSVYKEDRVVWGSPPTAEQSLEERFLV